MPRGRARSSTPKKVAARRPALERLVVINLARREDRQARIVDQLIRAGLHERAELFRAFDAHEIDDGLLERMGLRLFPKWEQPGSAQMFHARPLKLGEVGCALSHYSVWRMIVARGWQTTLVLEDDVVFPPTLLADAETLLGRARRSAPGWDLLYLGRNRTIGHPFSSVPPAEETRVARGLVRPGFSYCAHAYVLSLEGAKRLLASGFQTALCAVDEFLPALYYPHPRADVRKRFGTGSGISALAAEPSLVSVAYESSDTDASKYAGGEPAPRYRWKTQTRQLLTRGPGLADALAFTVAGRAKQIAVSRQLREIATRLVASKRPGIDLVFESEAASVLEVELLLFQLLQSRALAR